MFLQFASWLHKTSLSLGLQHQVGWLWPLCETLHFTGLALLLGVVGMFDLRLLGFMQRVPISVVRDFMPWALVGFTLNLLTGTIFVISQPATYFGNYTWWLKVALLLIAGVNAIVFETTYGRRRRDSGGRGHTVRAQSDRGRVAGVLVGGALGRPHAAIHQGGTGGEILGVPAGFSIRSKFRSTTAVLRTYFELRTLHFELATGSPCLAAKPVAPARCLPSAVAPRRASTSRTRRPRRSASIAPFRRL